MKILQLTKSGSAGATLDYKNMTRMAKPKTPKTHVIFDLDGTILDTENLYGEVFKRILTTDYGVKFDDEVQKALVGLKTMERCNYLVEKFGLPISAKVLFQRLEDMREDVFSNTKLKPGAEELITHLHSSKVPIAVATASSEANLLTKTKSHSKLFGLFHHIVHASDPEVPVHKPDPLVYLVCAKRFEKKPQPKECLVFEDSYNGLLAGTRAGMEVVFVPEHNYPDHLTKDAVMIIKSLKDFKPEQFSLPPYPRK